MQGRIPQNFIDDLLNRVDIVETVNARVPLKKSGKNYSACCPFHDEKSPSFTVSPSKQFYYCFGCGAGGNAIGFVMEHDRISFPEAVETLAGQAGVEVPRESLPDARAEQKRKNIYSVLEQADRYYRTQLKGSQKAIDYLKSRGLDGRTARDFGIGYAPEGWDHLLNLMGNDDEQRRLLIEAGMLIERDDKSGFYDRFRDRIMFPIRDMRGRTIAFGGRVFGDEKPKYLNSPETPVFHKSRELYGLYESVQRNRHLKQLIVVEGYMDVVALAQFGVLNAVATLGTSVGATHIEKMFRHVNEIVFCFDGDNAGRSAASRALEATLPAMLDGRKASFLFLPEGEDPDSLVQAQGAEEFQRMLANATPLSEFIFQLAGTQIDISTADGKAQLCHAIEPWLGKLPKGFFRNLLINQLGEVTQLPPAQIAEILQSNSDAQEAIRAANKASQSKSEENSQPQNNGDGDGEGNESESRQTRSPNSRFSRTKLTPMRSLISLILSHPKLASLVTEETQSHLSGQDDYENLQKLLETIARSPNSESAALMGRLASSAGDRMDFFNQIFSTRLANHDSVEEAQSELEQILNRLVSQEQTRQLNRQLDELNQIPFDQLTPDQRQAHRDLLQELSKIKAN